MQESTQVLRELEISLRTNHIGWVAIDMCVDVNVKLMRPKWRPIPYGPVEKWCTIKGMPFGTHASSAVVPGSNEARVHAGSYSQDEAG